jgi:ribonuclease E
MGISPLVKLGRELTNPKTAIINVVPVGTLPLELLVVAEPTPTIVESEDSPDLEPTESIPTDDFVIPVVMEELSSEIAEVVETPVVTEVTKKVIETPIAEVVEIAKIETVEALTAIVDEPEELPENRRRKRRSSAVVDGE